MFKEYTMEEAGKMILSGKDFSVGSNEKARSKTVFHVELSYTCGNYRLFYEGTEKTLRKALQAIEKINDPETSEKTKAFCFYTLVDCLWFVEHKSTKKIIVNLTVLRQFQPVAKTILIVCPVLQAVIAFA